MRLLPDKDFKANYKKRYDANYEKIMSYRKERSERKANRKPLSPEILKQRILGGFATVIILGSFFGVGAFISSRYDEKESRIDELEQEFLYLDENVKAYQVINSDAKFEQINDALSYVTDLQNQYVSNKFSDDFEGYAARYLGSYNNNWASELKGLEQPVWQGYLDGACNFRDSAKMLFILYDRARPVLVAKVSFSIENNGNLGIMSDVSKMRLV